VDNDPVAPLESGIDELYKRSLADFVSARTALAKTLTGDAARRVKALQKPAVVPWVVNQVYWRARALYERVLQRGETLRAAQVSALEGRSADVRGSTERHRQAIAVAVAEGKRIASAEGVHPNLDAVARTLKALSLSTERPEHPGRLTEPLRTSSGFEALAGIAVKAVAPAHQPVAERHPITAVQKHDREAAAAKRRRADAVKRAEATVVRAEAAEAHAREEWERAKEQLHAARRTLVSIEDG
jgi:hypothetical protein